MTLPNLLIELLLMRFSIAKSDRVVTDAHSTASDLNKYFNMRGKTSVIYPGVPILPSAESRDEFESERIFSLKYFLFVGSLDPRKNFHRMFKAFELIDPVSSGVHLVIVGGTGWKNKSFRKLLKTHPLRHHIHLTGYVSRNLLNIGSEVRIRVHPVFNECCQYRRRYRGRNPSFRLVFQG